MNVFSKFLPNANNGLGEWVQFYLRFKITLEFLSFF